MATKVAASEVSSNIDSDYIKKQLNEGKLNLYNAIKLHRNDIVVSLINEWFKEFDISSEYRYFFNDNFCDSKTALHFAYELNDIDILRTLLNFNASPAIKDKVNNLNLTEVINLSKNSKMKQLLNDSFLQAIAQNNLIQIKNFIDSGLDLNSTETNLDNNTFLHWVSIYIDNLMIFFILNFIINRRFYIHLKVLLNIYLIISQM